jgi:hypothetical protein
MTTTPTFWGTQVTFTFDPFAGASDVSARPDNTFVIVWHDQFAELHGRHLSSLGSFTGGDFLQAMSGAETRELRLPQAVSLPDGTTRVFFHLLASPTEEDVFVNFPNSDFTGQTSRLFVVNTAQDEFLVDAAPTEFNNAPGSAIIYNVPKLSGPGSDLWFAHIAFNGLPIGSPIPIPIAANESVVSAKLAGLGNGNTIIVYHVFNFDTSQTFARYRVYDDYTDITGAQDAAATPGNDVFPAVCGLKNSSNGFVVVTQDALGLRYLYSAFGNAFTASVPGTAGAPGQTFAKAISPQITPLDDQGFIIAWTDTSGTEGDGSANLKVVLQRFGSNGLPIGDNVIIDNPGDQGLDSIATLDDGRVIVTFSNETGDATGLTTLAYRIVDPREKTIFGSSTPDNITSREDGATLFGFDNNDVLLGRAAADTLVGGTGIDEMRGEGGNDTYEVDNVGDQVIEGVGQGYDTVNTTLNTYTLGTNVERVNFIGLGNFLGIGNSLNNRFSGSAGNDRFIDVAGGADIFGGGQGTDTVDFRTSSTGVVLNFLTGVHGGAATGDMFGSVEKFLGSATGADRMSASGGGRVVYAGYGGDDRLNGNIKNDQLLGGDGNDILQGKGGPDSLDGGRGNDTMTGGADGDVFIFVDAAFGQDTITDFVDGLDTLKVFSAVADNINDFTISGNGTTSVLLTLTVAPLNSITLNGAAPINISAADFVFY